MVCVIDLFRKFLKITIDNNERYYQMTKKQIKQISYCILFCWLFGCIPQNQILDSDFEKGMQTDPQNSIDEKSEPCHLTENKPRPSWIDQIPQSKQQLFGMGVAPRQPKQKQVAKILAMRDITQQINVHVKSIYQEKITSNQATDIQSQTELTAEALLQGVKIIDQWNDVSTCSMYMLASVDIDKEKKYHDTAFESLNSITRNIEPSGLIPDIQSEGSCMIQGISPRQAQTIALQRARALAIDKANGIEILASKMVSDSMLVLDFIRSYSKGYIVREKVNWHPVRQFQSNSKTPPVLEYHVSMVADVYIPQKKPDTIGMEVSLNKSVYTKGERAVLRIKTRRTCQVGIFNIQANDRISMIFPHPMFQEKSVFPHQPFEMKNLYPEPLPEEQSNYEALFICASEDDAIDFKNYFSVNENMKFADFFRRYATISDKCTDIIIPYQVVAAIDSFD
jgi:hypothetical protein